MNSYSVLFVGDYATINVVVDVVDEEFVSEEDLVDEAVDLIRKNHSINPMHQGFHVDEVVKFEDGHDR